MTIFLDAIMNLTFIFYHILQSFPFFSLDIFEYLDFVPLFIKYLWKSEFYQLLEQVYISTEVELILGQWELSLWLREFM